ncbi:MULTISPECIES: porin [Myroides]|uniref:Phosphate-selective porin O and P n=1 Tax=Myroides albus TaxID=2562892 RepID=A0A6I3LRB0_9FLAO|nr:MULTISPECIES: porin [Myroides]MTG98505.1 hypothetical protein [Myroides albus]MVX36888.1 hypothetical protein [Myroides sp. LoEW2-1]UVD79528.1 OprO/OprP family phosphate-selective porin [Myroides albus]
MRNKLLLFSFLSLIGSKAIAQDFNQKSIFKLPESEVVNDFNLYLDTRYDYKNVFTPTQTELSQFQVNQTRIYLTTKLFNKVDFNFRYSFNAKESKDALEFAFLEYHINDNWAISAGKLFTNWGSFDIDYNGAELYMYTIVTNDIEVYSPGVNFMYYMNKHKFTFQISSPTEVFTTPEYKNKAYSYMLLWEGKLFNDKLRTRYGYSLMQHDSSKYYNWATIGNQLHLGKWIFESDWIYGTRNLNYSDLVNIEDIGVSEVRDNSFALSAKYKINKFVPYIRGIYNKRKDLTNNYAYSQVNLQAALEYYPLQDQNLFKDLRLFTAYIYQNQSFERELSHLSDQHENQIVAGIRWLIPMVRK